MPCRTGGFNGRRAGALALGAARVFCPARRFKARRGPVRADRAMKPTAEQFEKLALAEIDTLYRVANRLTRDAERAGDLVQETYLRAFRSRDAF